MAEQFPLKEKVEGSTPSRLTIVFEIENFSPQILDSNT